MAIRTRSAAEAAAAWKTAISTAGSRYTSGVQGAAAAYDAGVSNAGPRWAEGVSIAMSNGSYQSGVTGKGATYVSRAMAVGASRWSSGAAAAEAFYQQKMGPVISLIQGITLPEPGPRGSQQNIDRMIAFNRTMHENRGRL